MPGIGLNTGLRALMSSRFVLDTIGHNISNANTEGYSRQSVDLAAGSPLLARGLLVGGGVDARSVRRTVDTLLQQRLLTQTSVRGRLESRLTGLSQVEALLREPEGSSIGARLDALFGSISGLSTNPTDGILRTGMVNAGVQLTGQLNQVFEELSGIRRDTNRAVSIAVKEVNDLAGEIASLNREISALQAAGLSANDLMDRRDLSIERLSSLVDVTTQDDPSGTVRVLVGGSTLVSSTRFHRMTTTEASGGDVRLRIEGAAGTLDDVGGSLGGQIEVAQGSVPDLIDGLDRLARNLIGSVNRAHAQGIPADGPYSSLVGAHALVDVDGDGGFRDELLSNAGLPFDVASGNLFVNVTDEATGAVEKHRIAISRTHTTVGDFLDQLSALPHLSADTDALGRIQLVADSGFGFDFSRRVDPNPDQQGLFGGGRASLGASAAGPYALADNDTLQLDVGGNAITLTFSNADFGDVGAATAEELAAVINADANVQANGLRAVAASGRLVLQTVGQGSAASFDVVGGSALGALGWSGLAGSTVSGHDATVDVALSGTFDGAANDQYTFVPLQDGTIGTTPGLSVDVLDQAGQRVATLEVGAGYVPGTPLEVARGISASFGLGELSATHNDALSVDVLASSDTADVLVATGIGSFFTGTGAADVAVRKDIALDPSRIASSISGSQGDTGILLDLMDVEGLSVAELDGGTLGEFYGDVIGNVGFEVASVVDSIDSNDGLMQSLELRRDQVSGVNVDEELVDLLQFEQAFEAASRYINTLNQLNDELLNLL